MDDSDRYVINGDPVLFSMAMDNIIGNAVKYATAGSKIRITTSGDHMTVENDWKPVTKFIKKPGLLFESFVTGDDTPGHSNSGLGLRVARDILGRMGITLSAKPGQRTIVFTIR